MKEWKAKIKEKGNDHILTPSYMFPNDATMTREDITKFWGLDHDDVEWYELELVCL